MHSQKLSPTLRVVVGLIGYILSPLSWWNDPVVNIPISYAAALLAATIHPALFPAAFLAAYLATNALGLMMLHWAATGKTAGKPAKLLLQAAAYTAIAYLAYILTS